MGPFQGLKPVIGKLSEAKKVFDFSVSHLFSQTCYFFLHAYLLPLLLRMQKMAAPECPRLHHLTSRHCRD